MLKNYLPILLSIVIIASFLSCSNPNKDKDAIVNSDTTTVAPDTIKASGPRLDMVISDIPFPFEVLENLHSSHVIFDQKVMNPVNNNSKYSQYNSKALNLGVAGADLAYVVTYEQFQEIGPYIKNAKKLAEELNIPFAFNSGMMDRYSKFKDNKDSLTRIVYDSYNQVDITLKDDERIGIAALVVTGSWLEGLYISTQTFLKAPKTKENESLYKTISGQKKSLGIVVKLLSEYKDDAYITGVMEELNDIASSYENVNASHVLNEQELVEINKKVEKLRSRIVEGL